MSPPVTWEESVFGLLDDLEQQAEGLALAEREAQVVDLSAAEYAGVTLAGRLHASVGREVRVRLLGGVRVEGRLARVGEEWALVDDGRHTWVLRRAALVAVAGLSDRADSAETWPVVDRLGLRALLRRLADAQEPVRVHATDGQSVEGRVGRVGHDFAELWVGEGRDPVAHLVGLETLAAVQGRG